MSKDFQWTDDLVKEFILKESNERNQWDERGLSAYLNKFKREKQPKEWEIIKQCRKYEGDEGIHDANEQCTSGTCTIHSVRRLTDGEVFSCQEETREGMIDAFKIMTNNTMRVGVKEMWLLLGELHKLPAKQLVLTTEDGVKKYKGDDCITVDTKDDFHISGWYSLPYPLRLNNVDISAYKYFNTSEAAEEYVKENKPLYSEKIIRKAFSDHFTVAENKEAANRFCERLRQQLEPKS
jgi:hypothetical protein